MSFYLDTSAIISALIREGRTDSVHSWLASQDPDALMISDWVVSEISAALSLKLRTREIDPPLRAAALASFQKQFADRLLVAPVTPSHFRTAARFCDQHGLELRAADALHLAVSADYGATLVTLDRILADSGAPLGVATLRL